MLLQALRVILTQTYFGSWLKSLMVTLELLMINDAFRNCDGLAKVVAPNSVTHIGDCAFQDCSSLVRLTIPNSVTHIGDYAFQFCSSLVNLTMPDSVARIGNCALANRSLVSLNIPDPMTHFKKGTFAGCNPLVLRKSKSGTPDLGRTP